MEMESEICVRRRTEIEESSGKKNALEFGMNERKKKRGKLGQHDSVKDRSGNLLS